MTGRVGHAEFVAALRERFPEVAADIAPDVDAGLLHLDMGAFLQHTLVHIRAGDPHGVTSCFAFADWLLQVGDEAVRNAVAVAYLEHLGFEGRKTSWAKPLLPPRLARLWSEVTDCMRQARGTAAPPVGDRSRRNDRRPSKA